ncbi:hypothetical protein F3Y22_tig00110514pilonHSYRG00035 [Hibiscus syriacus]|uniref:Uncharacterized protein n=1 Tax=Hibiscus syriacus TaxID=106335 RepID=A0A6A3AB53_HIBSY|nr:hypothetical protein F3Y22_tig00110514pilonHSYRG00035 [Hibiscus syriacus]
MELFICPAMHGYRPIGPDGTIPSNRLRNFEHSFISMTFFTYAAFSILLDKISPKATYCLSQFVAAVAFAQQLLLFHFHSADHMRLEGHYHLLLQSAIVVSLTTTLLAFGFPNSFIVSFMRSVSVLYQGVWLVLMGYVMWTPSLVPRGCFLQFEDGHQIVSCSSDEVLHRAKSLVNILFSSTLIVVTIFTMTLYVVLDRLYGQKVEYSKLRKEEEESDDFESPKESALCSYGIER